jgi:transposase
MTSLVHRSSRGDTVIGDIRHFPSQKYLLGYAGLGASVHASGETSRYGDITKQGRRDLRARMIESAWIAVIHDALETGFSSFIQAHRQT